MLSTEGGDHLLPKIRDSEQTEVCEAVKIQRKHSMAYEIHKFAGVMHAAVVAEGGHGCEMCTAFKPQAFFEELKKRKNSDLNGQKSDKSEQKGQKRPLLKLCKGQKWHMFDWKY